MTVVRDPVLTLIREMRAVNPPVYGPTGGTTCAQEPMLDRGPPVPPSAT